MAPRLPPKENRKARRLVRVGLAVVVGAALLFALNRRFPLNRPVEYDGDRDHFLYGSIGSDISGGLPVKVLLVLPGLFPEHLPRGAERHDLSAFGFLQEPGHKLPVGFSVRRQIVDLTAPNCAACHTGSVREAPGSPPILVPGMPASTVDLHAFFRFLFDCAKDSRFTADRIFAAIEAAGLAEPLDGFLYGRIVPKLKAALIERADKLAFVFAPEYPRFGPGRVSTFDTFKLDQFAPYYRAHGQALQPDELYGIADFPSVWNQAKREGLRLHWDGNNTSVRERNFSAAIGAGALPRDVDLPRLFRVEAFLKGLPPPPYPFAIEEAAADRGASIYRQVCFDCHDFQGSRVGTVFPIEQIGTDRHRLDSYTQFLLEAQKDYTKGEPWAFSHFTKTEGYASHPLDGIWARAPYLHNGSVPTLRDLLTPAEQRPEAFTTGGDVYDQQNMGFAHERLKRAGDGYAREDGSRYAGTAFVLDTHVRASGNAGHSGPIYGTELPDDDKRALIEYFKRQDRPR